MQRSQNSCSTASVTSNVITGFPSQCLYAYVCSGNCVASLKFLFVCECVCARVCSARLCLFLCSRLCVCMCVCVCAPFIPPPPLTPSLFLSLHLNSIHENLTALANGLKYVELFPDQMHKTELWKCSTYLSVHLTLFGCECTIFHL